MNEQAPEEKKPPGLFKRIITWPFRLSLPAKAAWVLFFFLLTLVIVTWSVFFADDANLPWYHAMGWGKIAMILGLVTIIPIVVYFGLRLWLQGEASQFPEIDRAWKEGLDQLRRNGIDFNATPVFLIIGSSGEKQERAIMTATQLPLRVERVPAGPSALHWYANTEGIYLFCSEASWLSSMTALKEKRLAEQRELQMGMAHADALDARPNLAPSGGTFTTATASTSAPVVAPTPPAPVAPAPPAAQPAIQGGSKDVKGTIMVDQFIDPQGDAPMAPVVPQAPAASQPPPAPAPSGPAIGGGSGGGSGDVRGTMMLPNGGEPTPSAPAPVPSPAAMAPPIAPPPAPAARVSRVAPAIVPAHESAERQQQLKYVCQLLRRAREPVCAINGVLTLVPFEVMQSNPIEVEELQRAVKTDLMTIQREIKLRCPVTALVVGLERERGFAELVRRVGRERAAGQRFGRKYDVRSLPTSQELTNLSAHVCGAFEDWVYTLFRDDVALRSTNNNRLYGLLCKVRCHLKSRLAEILSGGFAYDKEQTPHDDPVLFSGCYFAATGESQDRQAFVKGVFDKLIDEQEHVEWTRQALEDEHFYKRLAYFGLGASGVLLALLAGIFLIKNTS